MSTRKQTDLKTQTTVFKTESILRLKGIVRHDGPAVSVEEMEAGITDLLASKLASKNDR